MMLCMIPSSIRGRGGRSKGEPWGKKKKKRPAEYVKAGSYTSPTQARNGARTPSIPHRQCSICETVLFKKSGVFLTHVSLFKSHETIHDWSLCGCICTQKFFPYMVIKYRYVHLGIWKIGHTEYRAALFRPFGFFDAASPTSGASFLSPYKLPSEHDFWFLNFGSVFETFTIKNSVEIKSIFKMNQGNGEKAPKYTTRLGLRAKPKVLSIPEYTYRSFCRPILLYRDKMNFCMINTISNHLKRFQDSNWKKKKTREEKDLAAHPHRWLSANVWSLSIH